MSDALAQRIAADCANKALSDVLAAPVSPLPGLVCIQFIGTFNDILNRAIRGSKAVKQCMGKTTPVKVDL